MLRHIRCHTYRLRANTRCTLRLNHVEIIHWVHAVHLILNLIHWWHILLVHILVHLVIDLLLIHLLLVYLLRHICVPPLLRLLPLSALNPGLFLFLDKLVYFVS